VKRSEVVSNSWVFSDFSARREALGDGFGRRGCKIRVREPILLDITILGALDRPTASSELFELFAPRDTSPSTSDLRGPRSDP
jgi:hypothetical protein